MGFGARKFAVFLIACYLVVNVVDGGSLAENYDEYRRTRFCTNSSFRCGSGECIDEDHLCDGFVHCKDGSDETRDCVNIIPCSSSFLYQCDYGACINKAQQCDGKYDCKDKSDESEIACAKCGKEQFRCDSGELIEGTLPCDGTANCADKSDETEDLCGTFNCPNYSFRCDYGACVSKASRCDGRWACVDGSDERDCGNARWPRLRLGQFQCKSGECVQEENLCDGIGHCRDLSDETADLCQNLKCPRYSYRCKYGACVSRNARCNGIFDCVDGSDEKGCSSYHSLAAPSPTTKCYKYEFKCTSGDCISENVVCNGRNDCADGSDETFDLCAFKQCPYNKFRCDYGGCVAMSAKCNNIADCWDASDERNCSFTVPTTAQPPAYESVERGGCAIPKDPDHGKYEISAFEKNGAYSTRSTVPDFSVLVTKCSEGYGPTPPMEATFSVCFNSVWTPPLQQCTSACPTILSTTQTQCKYENRPLKSCENPVHGTIALTPCDDLSHSLLQVCRNGVWDIPLSRCIPSTSTNSSGTIINIFYIIKDRTNR